MRRTYLFLIICSIVAGIGYFLFFRSEKSVLQTKDDQPLLVNSDTDPFNLSFNELLLAYFQIKDALVEGDTLAADAAASALMKAVELVRLDELKGDTTGAVAELALTFLKEIGSSAQNFNRGTGLQERRKQFESMTELVWNLTRCVRYSGEVIYYQFCPMAFDNKGAYWLSNQSLIRNPYFGDQMLTCGRVIDSLNYSSSR